MNQSRRKCLYRLYITQILSKGWENSIIFQVQFMGIDRHYSVAPMWGVGLKLLYIVVISWIIHSVNFLMHIQWSDHDCTLY